MTSESLAARILRIVDLVGYQEGNDVDDDSIIEHGTKPAWRR